MAAMKIATWNVNSLTARLPHVIDWLAANPVDVLGLQELKTVDEKFPFEALQQAGYQAQAFGQRTYNGVAILSSQPVSDVQRNMANFDDDSARVIAATVPAAGGDLDLYLGRARARMGGAASGLLECAAAGVAAPRALERASARLAVGHEIDAGNVVELGRLKNAENKIMAFAAAVAGGKRSPSGRARAHADLLPLRLQGRHLCECGCRHARAPASFVSKYKQRRRRA